MGSLFILSIYFNWISSTVLHPHHKLQYFKKAGWKDSWIKTSHEIIHTEFDQKYTFMDINELSDAPPPPSVCFFFTIPDIDLLILSYSGHLTHLPLTIFLTICQHFWPLWKWIFVTNWIIILALTLSMSPTPSLGGMRKDRFILASIAWH